MRHTYFSIGIAIDIVHALATRAGKLADLPIDHLRHLAASGQNEFYSPTQAQAELSAAYRHRGQLVTIILQEEFQED